MNPKGREVWTSNITTAATLMLPGVLILIVRQLILGATGAVTWSLFGTEPASALIPDFILLCIAVGVTIFVRSLVWRIVVDDSDVHIQWLLRRHRTLPLSSLTELEMETPAGELDSLILNTSEGKLRVIPTPPRSSAVVKRLERAVNETESGGRPNAGSDASLS